MRERERIIGKQKFLYLLNIYTRHAMLAVMLKTPTIHIITSATFDNPVVGKIYIHLSE